MKVAVWPALHLADVGLVDVDLELHLRQVLGQREQHRRLEARRPRSGPAPPCAPAPRRRSASGCWPWPRLVSSDCSVARACVTLARALASLASARFRLASARVQFGLRRHLAAGEFAPPAGSAPGGARFRHGGLRLQHLRLGRGERWRATSRPGPAAWTGPAAPAPGPSSPGRCRRRRPCRRCRKFAAHIHLVGGLQIAGGGNRDHQRADRDRFLGAVVRRGSVVAGAQEQPRPRRRSRPAQRSATASGWRTRPPDRVVRSELLQGGALLGLRSGVVHDVSLLTGGFAAVGRPAAAERLVQTDQRQHAVGACAGRLSSAGQPLRSVSSTDWKSTRPAL